MLRLPSGNVHLDRQAGALVIAKALAVVLCSCIAGPATGPYQPAVRLDPPPVTVPAPLPEPTRPVFSGESINGVCVGALPLLMWYSPGWPVERMAAIMYRESRCDPFALYPNRNVSTATGLLQILSKTHCPWISIYFGERCDTAWLQDPYNNIRAGAELYRRQGISAWLQTS